MSFPNTKNVAHFDSRSQLIFLDEIRAADIETSFQSGRIVEIRENISTIYHEITHWVDTVGTLWGNDYLKTVYQAYDTLSAVNIAGSEFNFHRFIDVHDNDRRLSFSDYYRTVEGDDRTHSLTTPWSINFSCGVEFNSSGRLDEQRPMIFVRFGDHYTEKQLVRQPLSVAALLETTATWSELSTQFKTVRALPQDERRMNEYMLKREYGARLYSPELTLYSAPVHLLAHFTKVREALAAYHLGSMISLVCLNLAGQHFRKLKVPRRLEAWGRRVSSFTRNQSRPFAFMCICMNAPAWDDDMNPLAWVNAALLNSALPNYDEILGHAVDALRSDNSSCIRPEMAKRQKYLRNLGADWLMWRKENGDAGIDYEHLSNSSLMTPVIFDATSSPFLLFGSKFDTKIFNPTEMFDEEASLHTQILKLRDACR